MTHNVSITSEDLVIILDALKIMSKDEEINADDKLKARNIYKQINGGLYEDFEKNLSE